ncbi:MAG: hypothetical protein RPS47_14395 [Colwellia sp.]|jgi:Archaeal ATPase.
MKAKDKNAWHYPRLNLATTYLDLLDIGLTNTIALFARRRSGKTEFVTHDLLPEAERRGAITYTVDFWANDENPEECVVMGVMDTFNSLSIRKKLKGQRLKEFKASLAGLSASIENPSISTINQAFALMRQIHSNDEKKVILFFDEIQHLATKTEYSVVAGALRTFIDKNKSWLTVVFTGSSQDGLMRLFKQRRSAFYEATAIKAFPLLGPEYISYTINEFNHYTGLNINPSQALRVFKDINNNPEIFSHVIEGLLISKRDDILIFYQDHSEEFSNEADIQIRWDSLTDFDSSVLGLLVDLTDQKFRCGLYCTQAYNLIKEESGSEKVTKSTVQYSIDKLRNAGWIYSPSRGKWEFEDEADLEFIRDQRGES